MYLDHHKRDKVPLFYQVFWLKRFGRPREFFALQAKNRGLYLFKNIFFHITPVAKSSIFYQLIKSHASECGTHEVGTSSIFRYSAAQR